MSTGADDGEVSAAPRRGDWLARIGVDWWATIVAALVVLLAVAGLLPRIPW